MTTSFELKIMKELADEAYILLYSLCDDTNMPLLNRVVAKNARNRVASLKMKLDSQFEKRLKNK